MTSRRGRIGIKKKNINNLFKHFNILEINEIINSLNKVQICEFQKECDRNLVYLGNYQKKIENSEEKTERLSR